MVSNLQTMLYPNTWERGWKVDNKDGRLQYFGRERKGCDEVWRYPILGSSGMQACANRQGIL